MPDSLPDSLLYLIVAVALAFGAGIAGEILKHGCKGGWFYFGIGDGDFVFGVVPSLDQLVSQVDDGARVLVDIPIGLRESDGTPRGCDAAARARLGSRSRSVFPTPIREILRASSYEEANERSRSLIGKGLSRQSFGIMPKIAEVDELVRTDGRARAMVREVHPEVCFWGLANRPMEHPKKTQAGFEERLKVLTAEWERAEEAASKAYLWTGGVARDDVLDALVNAVVSTFPEGRLRTLPEDPEQDPKGLPMEMVYGVSG